MLSVWVQEAVVDRILEILEQDARTTPEAIAEQLGRSVESVRADIARLEADNIIVGYRPVINYDKLRNDLVTSLIEVRVRPERGAGYDGIAKRIYQFPEVRSLYLVSGTYDFLLLVEGKTLHDVALFVAEKLSPLENVESTTTHFLLKTYKENRVALDGEQREDTRLPVTP